MATSIFRDSTKLMRAARSVAEVTFRRLTHGHRAQTVLYKHGYAITVDPVFLKEEEQLCFALGHELLHVIRADIPRRRVIRQWMADAIRKCLGQEVRPEDIDEQRADYAAVIAAEVVINERLRREVPLPPYDPITWEAVAMAMSMVYGLPLTETMPPMVSDEMIAAAIYALSGECTCPPKDSPLQERDGDDGKPQESEHEEQARGSSREENESEGAGKAEEEQENEGDTHSGGDEPQASSEEEEETEAEGEAEGEGESEQHEEGCPLHGLPKDGSCVMEDETESAAEAAAAHSDAMEKAEEEEAFDELRQQVKRAGHAPSNVIVEGEMTYDPERTLIIKQIVSRIRDRIGRGTLKRLRTWRREGRTPLTRGSSRAPAKTALVAIDLSGSMCDDEALVNGLAHAVADEAYIVPFDARVRAVCRPGQRYVPQRAGGGTIPQCLFPVVEQLRPDIVIVITDGEFEPVKEPDGCPWIWLTTDTVPNVRGEVIQIGRGK